MPIIRYFLLTGSVLLALLFAADRYLPPPPDRPAPIDVDRSIIRLHSAWTVPEKIVFDTAHPPVVVAAIPVEANEHADRARQALAMVTDAASPPNRSSPSLASPAAVQRHAVRPHRKVRRAPERSLAAEQHGFFSTW